MYNAPADFGHHLIVGLAGTKLLDEERRLLGALAPSGIILFRKNLSTDNPDWQSLLAQLLADVRSATGRADLLIAVDHEGGRVHRFPSPVSHFPAALHLGEAAEQVGEAIGCELRALGFNLDFAPVLDCFSEPENKVIGDRAFACEYSAVARHAIAFARGMERHGVLSCGKHFPGHGGTIADSHLELPRYDGSREQLLREEIAPFVEFIQAGFPFLMTAHVLYPQLDPGNPASLSQVILDLLLRQELGFSGCLITDDLEMKALDHLTPGEKGLLALRAGTDLLLEANYHAEPPLFRAYQMVEHLHDAVTNGALPLEKLAASRARVDRLLAHAQLLRVSAAFADYGAELIGCESHQELDKRLRG